MVVFVLGLRTFSRQGLFVVGGALVDRLSGRAQQSQHPSALSPLPVVRAREC